MLFVARPAWCAPDEPASAPPSTMQRLRGEAELGVLLATPFEGAGGGLGFGWRFALGIGWDRVPLTFGFDFQTAYFGESNSRDVVMVGSEALEIDKARSDSVLFLDAVVRLQPPYWPVRPYLEGIVGPKQLRTDYAVTFVGGAGAAETSEVDWTYTVGAAAGVDIPLSKRLWLTASVRYLAGGRASYSRAVASDSDVVIRYDTSTTTTVFTLGLAARFSGTPEGG
jgi:opacity protein-like surface antigen